MDISLREQILQAILTLLEPVAVAHGASLHRSPTVALTREQSPALVLYPQSDAITQRANDRVSRELTIRLVAMARAIPPNAPETLADQLLTQAHRALFTDSQLGELVLGIQEEACEWDVEDADAIAASIPASYRLIYRTMAHDLALKG
jgi:hypothetical protein